MKDKKARMALSKGVARELRRNRPEIVNVVNRDGLGLLQGNLNLPTFANWRHKHARLS